MHIEVVQVVASYDWEPRRQKTCTVCEKRRLVTRQRWRIGTKEIEAFICNPCLTETPPGSRKEKP